MTVNSTQTKKSTRFKLKVKRDLLQLCINFVALYFEILVHKFQKKF